LESNIEKNILFQFIESIPQYVWWKDVNSIFLGCNVKLANYVGLKNPKEIIGKSDFDIFSKKEDAEFVRKIDQQIITSGQPQLNYEVALTLPDIGKRWLSTSKIPMYDKNNIVIGTIGWFSDITEFKEMQIQIDEKNKALFNYSLQLRNTNRELELANIDLEKFTFAASHDLKSPIRTMKVFAQLLKKNESQLRDKSLEYIDFICQSSDRMATLIDDILSYAQTGIKDMIPEYIDLHEIVSDKLIGLKSMIESKSAVVNLDLPSTNVKAYSKLISLVFYNLINNGIKFNNSSTPIINCSCLEKENNWVFSIEDNGIGINAKYQQEIFLPFTRLVTMEIEGSGIGLSICKRIVTLHEGEIWVQESTSGRTVISFSIAKDLK